jgi:hypothetical protein
MITCRAGIGTDGAQLAEALRAIRTGLGDPEVLLYNAGTATLGAITEITPDQYEADWRINAICSRRSERALRTRATV